MKPLEWINTTVADTTSDDGKELEDLRRECLIAMSQIDTLSNHKWHFFRKLLNEYDFESREFAVNRAFYKLWEMLKLHPDIVENNNNLQTLHLAEAPGSFVQVVKKMFPESNSVSVSRPPSSYAEVVRKSRSIPVFNRDVLKLPNCQFYYTDLTDPGNIAWLKDNHGAKFDLITADGGFDEEERYDAKEILHYNLIMGEIVAILSLQKPGGSAIIKIFETFTDTTISMLWLLCQHYVSFDFVKPSTSRPTNAEKYVVCKRFKGFTAQSPYDLYNLMDVDITNEMVLNVPVPDTFRKKVVSMSKTFSRRQIDTINSVMTFVNENNGNGNNGNGKHGSVYIDKRQYNEQKKRSFDEWKKRFDCQ
jgi:23S rRNA U2552 (ribose-2'-O)-methylase RlmE/FtsJ